MVSGDLREKTPGRPGSDDEDSCTKDRRQDMCVLDTAVKTFTGPTSPNKKKCLSVRGSPRGHI